MFGAKLLVSHKSSSSPVWRLLGQTVGPSAVSVRGRAVELMKLKPTVGTAAGGLSKKKQPPPLATPVSTPKTRERRFLLSWRKSRKAEAGHTPSLWSRSSSKGHDHSKTTPKTQEEERQQGDAGATTTRLRRASTLDGPEGEWGFRSASVDVEAICSTSSQVGRSNPSCLWQSRRCTGCWVVAGRRPGPSMEGEA